MKIFTYLPLVSCIFVAVLGIFVLSRNIKSKLNILFLLFCTSIGMWLFGTYKMFISTNEKQSIFWDRFIYSGVVFIPIFMHHFSVVFCKLRKQGKYLISGYVLAIVFLLLSQTDYFVSGLYKYKWGCHTIAQPAHHIFLLVFWGYVVLLNYNLYKYYKSTTNAIERNQAKYVFTAFMVLFAIGACAYLPAYTIPIFPFPFISGVIFSAILGYAIARYKLLDINFVIKKTITTIILIFLMSLVFWLIGYPNVSMDTRMLLGFIASCITVAYFPKLKTKTENVVSKLLYKNKYQYQDELLKFIEKMVLIPYEDKLVSETINVLKKGFGVEKAVIFIRDMFMDDYRIKVQIGMKNDEQIKIKMDNDLVLWLKDNNDIFIKGETDNIDNRNMVINSGKVLEQIGCDLCVPIKLEKDLIGFIILGHKMSKEMFSIDDLGILHRYGTQLAVALDYKRIEAELRKDQQLADIGIMAMEISHEMRNLLQMPQTFIDLAKERANDVDFMTNFRAGALDRMKVISSKLFDIMYFGKERPLNIGYVNINELMDANLLAHDYTIKSRNIEIAKEYNELAIVVGDKEQLTQLFNNIIINSLDAMKGRTGKIRIRTTKNTDLTKEMQDKSKEWIRVEIKDDGSGIPDHVMKKLFTPFITTKSMGGLKRGGTGLGLAVVKKVVSAHKGHITVHSKEDKGTTFIVDLPVDVKDKYSVPPIHGEPWEYKE